MIDTDGNIPNVIDSCFDFYSIERKMCQHSIEIGFNSKSANVLLYKCFTHTLSHTIWKYYSKCFPSVLESEKNGKCNALVDDDDAKCNLI